MLHAKQNQLQLVTQGSQMDNDPRTVSASLCSILLNGKISTSVLQQ